MYFPCLARFLCLFVPLFLVVQQVSLAFSLNGSRLLLSDKHSMHCGSKHSFLGREKSSKVSLEAGEQPDDNCYANWNSNRSTTSIECHCLRYTFSMNLCIRMLLGYLFDRRKFAQMESQLGTKIAKNFFTIFYKSVIYYFKNM